MLVLAQPIGGPVCHRALSGLSGVVRATTAHRGRAVQARHGPTPSTREENPTPVLPDAIKPFLYIFFYEPVLAN